MKQIHEAGLFSARYARSEHACGAFLMKDPNKPNSIKQEVRTHKPNERQYYQRAAGLNTLDAFLLQASIEMS